MLQQVYVIFLISGTKCYSLRMLLKYSRGT